MARGDRTDGLSPAAREVDAALAGMDARIDWLTRLTPVNLNEVWAGFRDSNYRQMPALRYDEGLGDLEGLRKEIFALPVRNISSTVIESLLIEKQRELDRQLELVRLRGQPGFILASLDLFGGIGDRLIDQAERIIDEVPATLPDAARADAEAFADFARQEVDWYRKRAPSLAAEVVMDSNPGTHIFVSNGNLHVACDYRVPVPQMVPLLNHEVGTHVVTRHNGRQQPLKTLEVGLADYDALQEGLAVLGEYLCGYLPPTRLRTLAARVIAASMAVREESPADIFAAMYDRCRLGEELSFSTTTRALRGGGMTKDALYLGGLSRLLAYLSHGHDFEILFIGKFALKHLPTLEKLLDQGLLSPPELLPRYLENERARERLARVRSIDITKLWQETS